MRELFDARLNDTDTPRTNEELVAMVKEADVLVPTVTDRIDADLIAAAGDQLKLIASFGTGVDHIDLAAAKGRGQHAIQYCVCRARRPACRTQT